MPERELARESHHHVPRLAGIGEVKNQRGDGERVVARECRQRDEQRGEDGKRDGRSRHVRLPSSPWGRNRRTRINRPKLNMLFAEGAMKRPASASDTPISTPPRRAPPIEPSPPTMTMTKARSV